MKCSVKWIWMSVDSAAVTKPHLLMGVDPGIEGGAYALYNLGTRLVDSVSYFPTVQLPQPNKLKKAKSIIDVPALAFDFAKLEPRLMVDQNSQPPDFPCYFTILDKSTPCLPNRLATRVTSLLAACSTFFSSAFIRFSSLLSRATSSASRSLSSHF